jgi:hypothetical protein
MEWSLLGPRPLGMMRDASHTQRTLSAHGQRALRRLELGSLSDHANITSTCRR